MRLLEKLAALPRLGVGISAEYESYRKGMNLLHFQEQRPDLVHFVEFGGDLQRGLDGQIAEWAARGLPTTYHFLDVNLEEKEDLDPVWLEETAVLAREIGASWICGDAGLWHFGPRDRGQQTLLPPILSEDSARDLAESIVLLEEKTGFVCLPENPPGTVYLGPLHLLSYFAKVSEFAQCGILLDVAHLAIFQKLRGHGPLTGLDDFPLDRVVEVHVAGGMHASHEGFAYIEDSHAPEPLPETWEILSYVLARATNLKAIVYECEMNRQEEVVGNFETLNRLFPKAIERA